MLKTFITSFKFVTPKVPLRKLSSTSTVDDREVHHFKSLSEEWWNETGQFKGLHSMNKIRIPFIRDGLININTNSQSNANSPTPLRDLLILDVGCGGGILTEPLARIGANVTGLDANNEAIEVAKTHANIEKLPNIHYICSTIEDHIDGNTEKYDAIVASEVVEHVTHKQDFLKACIQCLKPGGSIFITTISQTWLANFGAIFLSENVFNFVAKGTHEYSKFIKPHNLQRLLQEENCKTLLVHGILYNFLANEWMWCSNQDVNYALHAVKLSSCK